MCASSSRPPAAPATSARSHRSRAPAARAGHDVPRSPARRRSRGLVAARRPPVPRRGGGAGATSSTPPSRRSGRATATRRARACATSSSACTPRTALPDMLAAVDEWRPDVIVRETMEFASARRGRARYGVPQVRVGIHLDVGDRRRRQARRRGSAARRARLAPSRSGVAAADARAASLTARRGATTRPSQRFREPTGAPATTGGRPLVYVTFGSEAPASEHFPGVYRRRDRGARRAAACACS